MGILGFTSFVDHRSKAFLQQEHVHNCHLVIDGDNVAHHIFKHKARYTGHGTDYSSYASEVESFFQDLKSCDITAVVLMDGAREVDGAKLPKQLARLTEKVRRSVRVATAKRHHEDVFPPLARSVFVQVARRLSVPVAQCPREADGCAAAVARRLGCAVLSDDSDLCALGVPVVRLTPWQRPCTAPRASRTAERFMICVVFQPELLLKHYGISADHLPLLATLPGNDVVMPAVLDPFFRRLYAAHSGGGGGAARRERPGQRIKATLRWLATQTSPREALDKVLSMLPEKDRGAVEAHATLVTTSMADESFEFLRSALPDLHRTLLELAPSAADQPPPPPVTDCLPVADAVLPVCVRDAAGGAPVLLEPGVEQLTEPAAAMTAAPLLARLASLLAGEDRRVTLYVREGREVAERSAAADWPAGTPPLVPLDPAADTARREAQVLAVLGVRPDALASAPPPLRLLVAALVAWRRATSGRSGRRAVQAALQACAGLVPDDTLPLPAESVAGWREKVAALRQRPAAAARDPAAVHLHYELQYVLMVAVSANEALGRPIDALDVDRTVHGPLAIGLGFCALSADDVGSNDTHGPDLDADMELLISRLTDLVEAVVEEGCSLSLPTGVTPAEEMDVDSESAKRLALLVAAASVTRTNRPRKRPRMLSRNRSKSTKTRSSKRSRN